MKIAVIGTGNIGGTLARKWIKAGHQVLFGVRDPNQSRAVTLLSDLGENAALTSIARAIQSCGVVVFAIPGKAMEETAAAHAAEMDGKILIDATNRLGGDTMHSLDILARHAPNARIFRAFNNLGWEVFSNPQFGDLKADLLYCGPAGEAGAIVEGLIEAVGLRAVHLGDLDQAPLSDLLTRIYFGLVQSQGSGRHVAIKVLGR